MYGALASAGVNTVAVRIKTTNKHFIITLPSACHQVASLEQALDDKILFSFKKMGYRQIGGMGQKQQIRVGFR
ncbi:hypothetical protein [Agrobacterium cavarae]|uniref:hypothetical protein n=1 Tax=Agrobacterium cavarae TaxID=2528239 RepID=UPI002FF53A9A